MKDSFLKNVPSFKYEKYLTDFVKDLNMYSCMKRCDQPKQIKLIEDHCLYNRQYHLNLNGHRTQSQLQSNVEYAVITKPISHELSRSMSVFINAFIDIKRILK